MLLHVEFPSEEPKKGAQTEGPRDGRCVRSHQIDVGNRGSDQSEPNINSYFERQRIRLHNYEVIEKQKSLQIYMEICFV